MDNLASSPSLRLSLVSPVYRAAGIVPALVARCAAAAEQMAGPGGFEIILVDDRSPDASWPAIEAAAAADPRVRGLRLSRNFGQQAAITAGLSAARGAWVAILDCDLQDRPEELPAMLALAEAQPYDLVLARRAQRNDPWLKRSLARAFYRVLSYLTGTRLDPAINAFGIYRKEVIEAILSMGDAIRYMPTMTRWVGFRAGTQDVRHDARAEGKSAYNFSRLFALAIDVILAFSDKPLRLMVRLGLFITAGSLLAAVAAVVWYFADDRFAPGWASLFVSLWLIAGLMMSMLGVVGIYLGKTFEQTKGRPVFIIAERTDAPRIPGAGGAPDA